jgi:hypothetical protein
MSMPNQPRRLQIVVSDEETGEQVAVANGVETLILLVAPGANKDQDHRRILIGDADTSVQLLFDIFNEMTEKIEHGTMIDLSQVIDDHLLLEVTDELPLH